MDMRIKTLLVAALLGTFGAAYADTAVQSNTTVQMHMISADGIGKSIGSVTISESKYGLVFTPSLTGLTPGLHGFHVHENPSCEPAMKEGKETAGVAAGGHLDPKHHDKHSAPWDTGHLGDLPALYVEDDGTAGTPVLAPRLKMSDVKSRSLMIHVGGDNYSDSPLALGGGGARMACGVIK